MNADTKALINKLILAWLMGKIRSRTLVIEVRASDPPYPLYLEDPIDWDDYWRKRDRLLASIFDEKEFMRNIKKALPAK